MSKSILPALDFNAVHSGDRIAAAYFGQAATEIRQAKRDAAYWRGQFEIERARRVEAETGALTLSNILDRIVSEDPAHDRP